MTDQPDPRPMSDVDLLVWAVVLGCRDQQERDGTTVLLLPFPPCPTCGETVHEATAWWVREPFREDVTIDVQPCGHAHRAIQSDIERVHDHASAMLDQIRADSERPAGEGGWNTERIITEARARVGEAEPAAAEPDDPELTVDEARDLVSDLSADLYWAQDRLGFVGECCDIADREQRTVTTADVREWLKGARCGRQLAADTAAAEATKPAAWGQLEARAFNAVLPALREVGEWLPLSARRAVAKAVLAAVQPELAGHYQHAVDAAVAAEQRAATAEAKLRRYQSWLAGQLVEAETRDQVTGEVPAELRISPHNGIASGLRTALYGLDRHLDGQSTGRPTPHGHVTTDAREWDGEKTGEQP